MAAAGKYAVGHIGLSVFWDHKIRPKQR